jgi:threonyl-tRNA synthetase
MERFVGGLIEHFAGAFPVWISPTQAVVMPITDGQHEYAAKLVERMQEAGIRVELDARNEKVNRKIRDAEEMKTPYMLVVGQKEVEAGTVSVRRRGKGDIGVFPAEEIIARIKHENDDKTRD